MEICGGGFKGCFSCPTMSYRVAYSLIPHLSRDFSWLLNLGPPKKTAFLGVIAQNPVLDKSLPLYKMNVFLMAETSSLHCPVINAAGFTTNIVAPLF